MLTKEILQAAFERTKATAEALKKFQGEKKLTATEEKLIAEAAGEPSGPTFAKNQVELAEILGVNRKSIQRWLKEQGSPRPKADGKFVVREWREWIRRNGRLDPEHKHDGAAEPMDLTEARLRGEILNNWRKEFRNAILQGEYWPKQQIRQVCAVAIQSAKTRSFSGLPRLVTLVRLAKDDEAALKAAREEMIAVWRQMESNNWFKPDAHKG